MYIKCKSFLVLLINKYNKFAHTFTFSLRWLYLTFLIAEILDPKNKQCSQFSDNRCNICTVKPPFATTSRKRPLLEMIV